MKRLLILALCVLPFIAHAQTILQFADSIRKEYEIPELAFAAVSADSVLVMHTIGVQRYNTNYVAKPGDRFHLGSNTKAITAFIAALQVNNKKLKWNTTYLSLFPELKWRSRYVYDTINLEHLLTFRGRVPGYTYTYEHPTKDELFGTYDQQRYTLAANYLNMPPMPVNAQGLTPSNIDYIMAGLMLEKATGNTYKELVAQLGTLLGIDFRFDYPNLKDTTQPWGHNASLQALAASEDYKMNWLLAAGNINVKPEEYVHFVQTQLKGLKGQSKLLPKKTFDQLLYGRPPFSFGWFNSTNTVNGHHIASNEGDAGAFLTRVQIIKEADRGYIVFTNVSSSKAREGITILMDELAKRFGE